MAEVIWAQPALEDLDAIADYIALDDCQAGQHLVRRVFALVEQLTAHPRSGSMPPELRKHFPRYRQLVEPPCRIFYRYDPDSDRVFVLHIMRGEMRLRASRLIKRDHKPEPLGPDNL